VDRASKQKINKETSGRKRGRKEEREGEREDGRKGV
jgi:hypothetical protein